MKLIFKTWLAGMVYAPTVLIVYLVSAILVIPLLPTLPFLNNELEGPFNWASDTFVRLKNWVYK